ncbi:MAG: TIGR00268 family protein, partial [Actinomycetota bacterium]|nr:TIGR00268 family protein [Actinomycetota bacterium]
CRVRHHGEVARIEVEQGDLQSVIDARGHIEQRLLALGFRYVTVDLGGFRSGSLNPHESTTTS